MALELPGWLVTAFNMVGLPWPGIDEDQLRAWATGVRQFANEITQSSANTHQTVAVLAEGSQSSFTDALAARWEHHNQLVADLHAPMDDFAEALDVAADVVVAQKYAVIAAASVLAGEFVATQIGAFFTFGADEAAVPAEVALTRQAVKFALEYLENELIGKLMGMAAQAVSDRINGFLANLLNDAFPVAMEVQSLKISYKALSDAAQKIRGHATTTEETGERAYHENANRDIEDSSEGGGDGDGGRFAAVVRALEQGLMDVAVDLFKSLPTAISHDQDQTAGVIMQAVDDMRGKDESLARDASHGARPSVDSLPPFWRMSDAQQVRALEDAPVSEVQGVLKGRSPGEQAAILDKAPLKTRLAVLDGMPKNERRLVFARLSPESQLDIYTANLNPSRATRFRDWLIDAPGDDLGNVATSVQDLTTNPATHSHATVPVSHPEIVNQPSTGLSAANAVTATLAGAVFVMGVQRWIKQGFRFFPKGKDHPVRGE